jgi:hypothetical protein
MSKNFIRRIDQVTNKVSNSPATRVETRTRHHASSLYTLSLTALAPSLLPSCPDTLILMDCLSEGSLMVDNSARRWTSKDICSRCRSMSFGQYHRMTAERRCDIGQLMAFDMLPDDVLLEIFDFYVDEDMREDFEPQRIQGSITLAHMCRHWRSVVCQSPRRLNLRLLCTPKTPARDILDIWPPLPLIIHNFGDCPELEYVTDSAAMHTVSHSRS